MSEIWSVAQESPVSAALVLLQLACFLGFGVLLAKQDMATHRLPNRLVASWLAASLAVIALLGIFRSDLHGVLIGLLGLLLLGGGYLLLTLASGGAMGMGDVKLAGVLGLNLGYYSLPSLFLQHCSPSYLPRSGLSGSGGTEADPEISGPFRPLHAHRLVYRAAYGTMKSWQLQNS